MAENIADGADDAVLVALGEAGEEGEAEDAVGDAFGSGEIAAAPAVVLLVIGMEVAGDVMQAGTDLAALQFGDEGVAIHSGTGFDHGREEVPGVGMRVGGGAGKGKTRNAAEEFAIAGGEGAAFFVKAGERGQLVEAEGGLQIHEVGFEAGCNNVVVHAEALDFAVAGPAGALNAVEAEELNAFGHAGIAGDDAATFAGGHVFIGVEGEDLNVAKTAEAAAFVGGADGVGAVFDDAQAVLGGEGVERVEVHRAAGEVDGHDGAGARGDSSGKFGDVEVVGAGLDVHEDGLGPGEDDGVERGDEGERGGDNLVTGLKVKGFEDHPQAHGGIEAGEGVRRAEIVAEHFLEFRGARASGQPAGAQAGDDLGNGLGRKGGAGEGQEFLSAHAAGEEGKRSGVLTALTEF